MGYIKHDIMISVLDHHQTEVVRAVEKFREELDEEFRHLIVISPAMINGAVAVVVIPDGSKEGWSESDKANEIRGEVSKLITSNDEYGKVFHFRFGGDDETMEYNVRRGKGYEC